MPTIVAIVPLFNHGRTVEPVLDGIVEQGLTPIIVDDGSTDDGAAKVELWIARRCPAAVLIRHERNLGKARALRTGFAAAQQMGATHALSCDADGQHDPRSIADFIAAREAPAGHAEHSAHSAHAAREAPAWRPTLVLGNRQPIPSGYPLARYAGRMLSGLAVRAACGAQVADAACGMRLYPLELLRGMRCIGGRYAWEEEMIVRCAWRGANVTSVTIPVIYRDSSDAPSHYRFARDWPEGIFVLVACVAERVINPRAVWAADGAPLKEMLWPLVRAGAHARPNAHAQPSAHARLMCALLACAGGLLAAVVAACCALFAAHHLVWLAAALAVAACAWRTRTPLLPMAVPWCAAALAPAVMLTAACLVLPLTAWWLLRAQIPRAGANPADAHAAS